MSEPSPSDVPTTVSALRRARHAAVAPLASAGLWIELRAAAGPAAGDPAPAGATAIVGDLGDPEVHARIRAAATGETLVTAFDALEHTPAFAPLLELLLELARDHGATVLLAVPNDDVGGGAPPERPTVWGTGGVAELRSLLPADHRLLVQVALTGAAVVPDGGAPERQVPITLDASVTPVAHLLAFGPRAGQLDTAAVAEVADAAAGHAAARATRAELEVLRAEVALLRERLGEPAPAAPAT
jgi:hypothetical protein